MPSLMRCINVISRCAGIYRTDRLRESDLGACHHSYVMAICRHPGISQEELSRHIYINKSNVTRHLSYLEEHGYVERRQSGDDKRVIQVFPTQRMLDVLPQIRAIVDDWSGYLTSDFTEEELDQFSGMLERVSARARAYVDEKDKEKSEK